MGYIKNTNFKNGNILDASDLIAMEDAIINLESNSSNSSIESENTPSVKFAGTSPSISKVVINTLVGILFGDEIL